MSSKAQKIKVGVFVAIAAALLALVIVVFGGVRFWTHRTKYNIVFDDSVMGLEIGAQVYLNGIKVGRVDDIALDEKDMKNVIVTITVKNDAPIHTDTTAMLQYAGITGLKVIDLRGGSATTPKLAEGATIPRGKTLIDKLSEKAVAITDDAEKLMDRARQITDNVAQITDPKRFEPVDDILASSRTTASHLAEASGTLKTMIAENRVALRETMQSVRGAADSTREIIDSQVTGLVGSASEVLADLKNIIHGSEGPIRSAVFDLRQASRNFKELSRDVRQRPSRLLFSSPPSERKLP
jgi:phospholipid/cholesterol/gamma-HCH transport system substrate-binding protein